MTTMQNLPGTAGIAQLMSVWRGASALVLPMLDESGRNLGNNGDQLMLAVFRKILIELGIGIVTDQDAADLVIVPPNGALLDVYSFPDLLSRRLETLTDLPLVIFPSSALFSRRDPSFIFRSRHASTLWVLRERRSLQHLRTTWGTELEDCGVRLVLDHDVVASGHRHVPELLGVAGPGSDVLVAARCDAEASSLDLNAGRKLGWSVAATIVDTLPDPLSRATMRIARRRRTRAGAERLLALLPASVAPASRGGALRTVQLDISSNRYASFAHYAHAIRSAAIVVTDRLHVGLPAAILGREVVLVEAGYHKIRGVYEQSLSQLPHVTFIDPTE